MTQNPDYIELTLDYLLFLRAQIEKTKCKVNPWYKLQKKSEFQTEGQLCIAVNHGTCILLSGR